MDKITKDKNSLTAQIVKILEHEIETGILPPLSKLPSTRTIAARFGVSKTVVLFALDVLEKRRLITRQERRGVFVSEMASNPDVLEVLILVFAPNPAKHSFINRILSIVSSPAAVGKINFFTRIVTIDEFKEYPAGYLLNLLKVEVAKLSQIFHSDCVMVLGPEFGKDEVAECLNLPFPGMFIGNFKHGDFDDLEYNRIGFAENHFNGAVDYAIEHNFPELLVVAPDTQHESQVYKNSVTNMNQFAQENNVGASCIAITNAKNESKEVRDKALKDTAQIIKDKGIERGIVLFSCVDDVGTLIEYMKNLGIGDQVGTIEFIISPLIGNKIFNNSTHYMEVKENDVEDFNEYLCEQLHELADGKLTNSRDDYYLKATVI